MKNNTYLIIESNDEGVKDVWMFRATNREQVAEHIVENEGNYLSLFSTLGYDLEEYEAPSSKELLEVLDNALKDEEVENNIQLVKIIDKYVAFIES